MNIVYLTWGETPRSYGVFGSQVIRQFSETKKTIPGAEFSFISAVPMIHSGMIREKFEYSKEIRIIKEKLDKINFFRIPIYASQNFVNSSKFTFKFMHFGAHKKLAYVLRQKNPDIVHCRGYHATYAAIQVREKYNLHYKVIFDARGLWPEEMALKKNYEFDNPNYLYLKNIENQLLKNSDALVTVSDTMANHYKKLSTIKVKNIYLSASTQELRTPSLKYKEPITLVYVGALSDDTWHKPKSLVELYTKFKSAWDKTQLIIVTTSNHDSLYNAFQNFPLSEINITSTKTINELKAMLSQAHFACLPYFSPKNQREQLISETILAVKTVEYLSAGLPVLCNKYCGGASVIIDNNTVGISYDPNTKVEINHENMRKLINKETKERAIALAERLFDYKENARRYAKLYQQLINNE